MTHQVRRLEGGRRGTWEDEKFGDETQAEQFGELVEAHGNTWPYGWVKGRGFTEPDEAPGAGRRDSPAWTTMWRRR
ncbi:hypothetical protein [Streptomyces lavendofoliae]|uniref:Uncharacterized protein n=1 Tax=Streptomyces lavendofoliae TaxID=67314 RepID=A0A918HY12_9ACTN|nr:hypothetical protein [Streptomyces lavendofoliae]GGU42409.1 hypothetical protein GCM10010274_33010 [Streptomyces lavendofoliae]